MPFVNIGGVTLHHRLSKADGNARPVVFINSLGTDFRIWDDVVSALNAEMPLLVYDKRGHGLSDIGDISSIDDHVDDLVNLTDHYGLTDIVLCGLSVGGLIAQGFYTRRPEHVAGMILCDTAHKIGTAESWNARIETVESKGIQAVADAILKLWFTPAFHTERVAELDGYWNMMTRQAVAGYVGTCAAVRDADFTEIAQSIAVPTLCAVGDQDGSTPPDLVRWLADLVPGACFEVIKDAGHIPCVEQPGAMTALIRQFVASLPQRRQNHG